MEKYFFYFHVFGIIVKILKSFVLLFIMKCMVIFIILLIITIPVSFAKEVSIPELFEVEKQTTSFKSSVKDVYFYGGGRVIAVNDEYKYQNGLGSDVNSKLLPFGQPLNIDERFSFTGKELDSELYYFNARYYDPNLGKFTSVDPVPSEPSYSYVGNDPMNFIDPTGTQMAGSLEGNYHRDSSGSSRAERHDQRMIDDPEYRSDYYTASAFIVAGGASLYGGLFFGPALYATGAKIGTTALMYPMETMIVGGMAANAIDPNPSADHLAGIPGDEIGNVIGAGIRKITVLRGNGAIAMDSSGTAIKFMQRINNGLRVIFKSGGEDGTNVLIHGDEYGAFLRQADDGSIVLSSVDDAAQAIAKELDPGETCVNLVSCYGDRNKIQSFTNALSEVMGHPMTVRADISGKPVRVGLNMPYVRRLDYQYYGVKPLPWQDTIYTWSAMKVPAKLFTFTPTN
jgi:RHS repeat-associated protein